MKQSEGVEQSSTSSKVVNPSSSSSERGFVVQTSNKAPASSVDSNSAVATPLEQTTVAPETLQETPTLLTEQGQQQPLQDEQRDESVQHSSVAAKEEEPSRLKQPSKEERTATQEAPSEVNIESHEESVELVDYRFVPTPAQAPSHNNSDSKPDSDSLMASPTTTKNPQEPTTTETKEPTTNESTVATTNKPSPALAPSRTNSMSSSMILSSTSSDSKPESASPMDSPTTTKNPQEQPTITETKEPTTNESTVHKTDSALALSRNNSMWPSFFLSTIKNPQEQPTNTETKEPTANESTVATTTTKKKEPTSRATTTDGPIKESSTIKAKHSTSTNKKGPNSESKVPNKARQSKMVVTKKKGPTSSTPDKTTRPFSLFHKHKSAKATATQGTKPQDASPPPPPAESSQQSSRVSLGNYLDTKRSERTMEQEHPQGEVAQMLCNILDATEDTLGYSQRYGRRVLRIEQRGAKKADRPDKDWLDRGDDDEVDTYYDDNGDDPDEDSSVDDSDDSPITANFFGRALSDTGTVVAEYVTETGPVVANEVNTTIHNMTSDASMTARNLANFFGRALSDTGTVVAEYVTETGSVVANEVNTTIHNMISDASMTARNLANFFGRALSDTGTVVAEYVTETGSVVANIVNTTIHNMTSDASMTARNLDKQEDGKASSWSFTEALWNGASQVYINSAQATDAVAYTLLNIPRSATNQLGAIPMPYTMSFETQHSGEQGLAKKGGNRPTRKPTLLEKHLEG